MRIYGAEYRGVVNYYLLAQDVSRLGTLCWTALTSMLKTLAAKHKSTVAKMAARFTAKAITADGPRTCFEARTRREGKKDLVARFGGIPLRQDRRAVITDPAPVPVTAPRKELITGSASGGASYASTAPRWQSTKSPRSPASAGPDRASPRGPPSWPRCGARRSSSAAPAMTGSTRTPSHTRHKSLKSPVHRNGARRVRREAARKRPGFTKHEHGTSLGGPPYQE